MEFILNALLLVISFILVIYGGNKFVDSAVIIAKKLKISPAIIGASIVSIGTTLPELLVSIFSSVGGKAEISVGNALGSIIFNSCIIGGILILFLNKQSPPSQTKTIQLQKGQMSSCPRKNNQKIFSTNKFLTQNNVTSKNNTRTSHKQIPLLLFCSVILFLFMCINGSIEIWESVILLFLFLIFVYLNFKAPKESDLQEVSKNTSQAKMPQTILLLIFSAALIAVGANALVNSASNLSKAIGISETIIGLTVVSLGTSLPEFVTAIISIIKKESDLGLGNIIGSNLINLLLLIGISGVISSPLNVVGQSLTLGVPFTLVSTALLCIPIILFSKQKRWQSFCLFATFAIYYTMLIFQTLA